MESIHIPESFHDWAIKVLKSQNEIESVSRSKILNNQRKEYDQVLKKVRWLNRHRASGELTKDEFERKKRSLSEEKERMNNLLKDTDNRVDDWLEKADKFLTLLKMQKKF